MVGAVLDPRAFKALMTIHESRLDGGDGSGSDGAMPGQPDEPQPTEVLRPPDAP